MGNLRSLVVKEIKELIRDPKILLGVVLMPLIMYPIMGSAMNVSQQSMMRAMASASFAVYNEDEGAVVDSFLEYIYTNNTVHTIEAGSLEDAIMAFQDTNASTLLYIREGYSDNVTQGVKANLKLYANLKSLSIVETESPNAV
ncbi:ABC transporter permease, partial [Candidatus Bathyarchaeota archaeon]|nr:ABC transporter permease [Candidatus Bathyarchaeota archaeon]